MPRERRANAKKAEKTGRTRATSVAVSETGREPSHEAERSKPRAGLYIVATPIGNLGDITLRALDTLRSVDAVACEDTRVTAKLFARHAIRAPLVAYHEHNAERMRPLLLDRLRRGESVALVSDAGTPLVSDPGFKLVRAAIAEGLAVTTIPGASAALAALVLSGLPSDRFFFAGFPPAKEAARRRALAELTGVPATLVFFENAPRLAAALADMAMTLGLPQSRASSPSSTRRSGAARSASSRHTMPPQGRPAVRSSSSSPHQTRKPQR
jgi:16S rRNA (cytidine1402-2'-O)-methyltransferase